MRERNLESQRPGVIMQGAGILFILLGLILGSLALIIGHQSGWITTLNLITIANGCWVWWLGRSSRRGAAEHKAFMDASRDRIARISARWN